MLTFGFIFFVLSSTGMDIGQDGLSPVTNDYEGPFKFSGKIHHVVVDIPNHTISGFLNPLL
jgi:hypothetical protein